MNRRVAAHKKRRGPSAAERELPAEAHQSTSSLAAQAAARVAARYAKAPSYSQMQAAEARTAVRAAEIATEVAIEAQATARAVLAGLGGASRNHPTAKATASAMAAPFVKPAFQPAVLPRIQHTVQAAVGPLVEPQREPEAVARHVELCATQPVEQPRASETVADAVEDWWQGAQPESCPEATEAQDQLESPLPALPFHANLIEFPREAASGRRTRPQLAELPASPVEEPDPQLSIYEVDPGALPPDSEAENTTAQLVTSLWSNIELEARPQRSEQPEAAAASEAAAIELAPLSQRMMAAVVDAALVSGTVLAACLAASANVDRLPSLRLFEMGLAVAFLGIGFLYQVFFFALADATPGMKYARISLCTFDDESPTRAQLFVRLGSMLLSVLPMGLGVAWAIFDEDHLSWHDRLSRTYQRRCER